MKAAAKVAISIPADTLASLERLRRKQGRSRSAAITEAIERWLLAHEVEDEEKRYVEGYLRRPERVAEAAKTASVVARTWERWK
jgi:metal-responsive CopG/Arc/MetJ family transcriptional regulator